MSSPTRALLTKELSQHTPLLLTLGVFALLSTFMLVLILSNTGGITTYLSIASLFAMPTLVLIAAVLGQQLVVKEYASRSQRFVEALPVARGHHEWVKWGLGFVVLLAIASGVWIYSASLAAAHESISGRFMGLMALRLVVYVFVLWSFVFTLSFLGRLRLVLAALTALALYALDTYTPFELDRFGPFELMDSDRFPSERNTVPLGAIAESLIIGGVALALARYFMRLQEGSFLERLSVPMSARDKSFVLVLAVVALGAITLFGAEENDFPVDLAGPAVATEGRAEVSYVEPRWRPHAEDVAAYLGSRTRELEAIVSMPDEFKVGVSFAPLVEPMEYNVDQASPQYGVLVAADITRTDDRDYFGAFVYHEVLDTLMKGRTTSMEPLHVLHDGFALYWAAHGAEPPPQMGSVGTEPLLVRALYGARAVGVDPFSMGTWDRTMEALGDGTALALAYSGWRSLVDEVGHDAAMDLARAVYGQAYHGDARDWLHDSWNPMEDKLKSATGITWNQHVERWRESLQTLENRRAWRQLVDALPVGELLLRVEPGEVGSDVVLSAALAQPITEGTECRLLHTLIQWYDTPLSPRGMREAAVNVRAGDTTLAHLLSGLYGSGNRVAGALECTPPGFVVPVRLGMTRITIP